MSIALLSLPMLFELIRESYMFNVKGVSDDHVGSTWLRAGMVAFVSILVVILQHAPFYTVLGNAALSCSIYVLFDPLLNMSRRYLGGRKDIGLFYYGDGAETDKFMRNLSIPVQLVVRAVVLTGGIILYTLY